MRFTTWISVDLDALQENYAWARARCGEATPWCVVKANAYGHGLREVALALQAAGVAHFAVSDFREGLALRLAGIDGDILVMGRTHPENAAEALGQELTLTLVSEEDALALQQTAARERVVAGVCLKVDTGFHRLGLDVFAPETEQALLRAAALPALRVESIASHLALRSPDSDAAQAAAFLDLTENLANQGLRCGRHLLDSIGLLRYPDWRLDAVRVGALLYGMRPADRPEIPLQDTLRFSSSIVQLRRAPAGSYIGYDEARPLARDSVIATLPVGYGDGYPRRLSGVAHVLVCGKPAPVVGLVCMDQMMVDVTDIPEAQVDDETLLLGGELPVGQVAAWAGTNRNELLAALGSRPPRVYSQAGKTALVYDDLVM